MELKINFKKKKQEGWDRTGGFQGNGNGGWLPAVEATEV